MEGMYNMRSPAVKRLMKEAQELREPTEQYECHPLEDNLFEWHFTIRGPADSDFDSGLYHGRIILPPEYPMKPPSILLLTHNGRFEVNRKICLSISGHHPESWQPSWSIRTALLAIIGFMPTHGAGALGSLDYPTEERKKLAKRSNDYKCPTCGCISNVLRPVTEESKKMSQEAKELASQMDFKDEKEKNAALKSPDCPPPENESSVTENAATEETNVSSQPQTVPPQFPAPPFGQFPFRMPFGPPFLMNPQQYTEISNLSQVPRFPLPYMAPMMPPFPPTMHPGNYQMPPMMPGMGVPPWNPFGVRMGTPPPVLSPAGEPLQQQTSRDTTLPSSATDTNLPKLTTDTNSIQTEATDSSSSQNAENTETRSNIDAISPENTETSAASPSTTNENLSPVQEGVRQRNTPAPSASSPRVFQHAELPHVARHSESHGFLVFALVIIAIIALLLFRRLYSMQHFSILF